MSTTNQNQTELKNFENIAKIRKNDSLLIYDGDLESTVIVTNKTKGTVYTIEDGECSCDGYKYRNECKHLSGLNELNGDDL